VNLRGCSMALLELFALSARMLFAERELLNVGHVRTKALQQGFLGVAEVAGIVGFGCAGLSTGSSRSQQSYCGHGSPRGEDEVQSK
jgi:hypothetical protein